MADFKCPGASDIRSPKPEFINCTHCGKEVEIFSDEEKVKCPHCKNVTFRNAAPSCIEWCKAAKQCVGEEKYNKLMAEKKQRGESR
jgi:NADH pyrophosphatase NudC (nudix superfamily)